MPNKFKTVSLGDGMEGEAMGYVELGAARGHWVLL
jgi:hypothetical protein